MVVGLLKLILLIHSLLIIGLLIRPLRVILLRVLLALLIAVLVIVIIVHVVHNNAPLFSCVLRFCLMQKSYIYIISQCFRFVKSGLSVYNFSPQQLYSVELII